MTTSTKSKPRLSPQPRRKRVDILEFSEGQIVVSPHITNPEIARAAIESAVARMMRSRKRGDAVAFLRQFRDDPRA